MAADEKWYFSKEQLANTPSRKCGYEVDKELSYRQQAANFIQDMGQRLQVTQLCINTAIVYMHRFYVFHSFTHFHRNAMASAALFLAAKVEEQPRKLEHVIKVAHMCLNRDQPPLDTKSEKYLEHAQDLVFNENVLLQTLGFDVAIDHPHTHVVRCCHLVRASKDLAQTSYFMASNSLHLTTMCLQYKPTVVACFCIHLACKWSNWEIPQSNEGKDWFWYVDKTVSLDQLEQLTAEFLVIFDKCPTKLKRKIMSISATQNPTLPPPVSGSLFDTEPRKIRPPDGSQPMDGPFHTGASGSRPVLPPLPHHLQGEAATKPPVEKMPAVPGSQPRVDYRDYKEKKERERLAQQPAVPRDGHHGPAHLSKSVPSSSSKHNQAPPAMLNKPHHRDRDHKHPPPVRPSGSQPRGRDQSYAKRENIFAPPIRHSEPQPPSDHHDTNHVGSASARKDNQPHEVATEHISRDVKAMQMESSSKRNQQSGFESSSRHNRVPTSANNSDGRVKEEVGHMYNHKHGVDHNRHRRMVVNEQFAPRPPDGVGERKPSVPVIPDIPDRKPNVNMHPAFSETRHESSSRRPDGSKHAYHQPQMKPEVKFESSAVKKEDIPDFSSRVGNSSLRPAPPLPAAIAPPLPPPPPPQALPVPVHHSQERHKSTRSRSPPAPPRTKSPTPPNRRSDSPHGKVKSNTPIPPRNGATLEEKPVVKRPETLVVTKQEPPVPEVEVSPVKVSSGERQKSSVVTPDKAPYPRSKSTRQRTPPSASKKTPTPLSEMPTTPVSSFGSPPLPGSASKLRSTNRHRTSSSSSEPELVPVVKKLDEIRGYENIIRDSKIGIKLPNRVPDIIPPIRDRNKKEELPSQAPAASSSRSSSSINSNNNVASVAKELKLPDLIGPIATMRSTNAKPPSLPDDLGAVAFPESDSTNGTLSRTAIPAPSMMTEESNMIDVSTVEENTVPSGSSLDHHHKSEKKKKKKEHKHKDKEKSREERKHRHKHKDKEKDRHKTEAAPIKITIPKDKIVTSILEPASNPGLKLKIMKDRLKDSDSTGSSPQSAPSGGLKIKISKDIISNFNSTAPVDTASSSRKRDRSSPQPGPPSKSARLNSSTGEQRRSGSSSNNYGKQNGVEHHRRGGGSHYSGNKVVQKLVDSDNAGKSS